jgi:single-strand DNA-binding protein
VNVLTIVGNLGRDAEQRYAGDRPVISFGVAMKSGFGDKAQTIWVDCSLWGKQAESSLYTYMTKGSQVSVSGEMGTREHDGKTYVTLRVSQITLCGGKPEGQQAAPQQQRQARAPRLQQQSQQSIQPGHDSFEDSMPFQNPYRGRFSLLV